MVSSSQLLYSTDELLPCVSSHQQLRPLLKSTRSTCTTIYTYNACLRTHFRDTYIPTNLRFSFGSCRFRRIIYSVCLFACLLVAEKETTARAGDPCNAAQHCRCHPVGLQQKVAATHAVNHIGPLPEGPEEERGAKLNKKQMCDVMQAETEFID